MNSDPTAMITDIKRFAVHDGPGIRTTVFFKGCPLRCVWCHNPECIAAKKETALFPSGPVSYGTEMTVEELVPRLLEDRLFYEHSGGGVTLSGGECLLYPDFLVRLLASLKAENVHAAIDTAGFVPWENFTKVLPDTDLLLYDIKAATEETHLKCTGHSNQLILENLSKLEQFYPDLPVEIRIPFVPGWNDFEMPAIAALLRGRKNIVRIKVLPYHNYAGSKYEALGLLNTLPSRLPTDEEIRDAQALFDAL